jgi:hypothetical protein
MSKFKAGVAIIAALVAAIGLALDAIQVTGIDTRWWTIIAFVVFCILVVWIVLDLRNKNKELEDRKPTISVTPVPISDFWYLEVTNSGEKGIFTAQVCLFEKEDNTTDSKFIPIGARYNALWGNTNSDKSEIMNGQTDIIKIASIRYTDTAQYFVMKGYDPVKKSSYDVRHIEYEGFRDMVHEQHIQVIISSDPSLKEGPFIQEYSISSKGITQSKPKKRISIPDQYMLGEIDESEDKYLDVKPVVEELKCLKIYDNSCPGDLLNVFDHLREKLAIGISEYEASAQDKLVLAQLSLRKIVQLEQRRKSSGPHTYDEGYWILTELGKGVSLYLQLNRQIFNN